MLSDMNVGDRLYSQNTAASSRKRSSTSNSRGIEEAWNSLRNTTADAAALDVRSEVDRMYDSIMSSIDKVPDDPNGSQARRHVPFVVNEYTNPRVATMKAMMKPISLKMYRQATGSTFGSGRKGMSDPVKKREDEPGPGDYHHSEGDHVNADTGRNGVTAHGLNVSATTSGIAARSNSSSIARPQSRGYSFGTSPRQSHLNVSATVRSVSSGAAALLQPGPGDYAVPSSFGLANTGSKKGSFGLAERSAPLKKDAPGPGTYSLDGSPPNRTSSPARAAFVSGTPRLPQVKSDTPGPGEYIKPLQPTAAAADAPAYTFPRASAKPPSTLSPGPGTYNVMLEPDRRDKGVIPTSGRDDGVWGGKRLMEESPGPGEYDPQLERGNGVSMKFRHPPKEDPRPGPGQYDAHDVTDHGPMWSFRGRPVEKPAESLPGPSDYCTEDAGKHVVEAAAAFSFGTSARELHPEAAVRAGLPGPGAYVTEVTSTASGVVMGTSKGRDLGWSGGNGGVDVPGPGAYDVAVLPSSPAPQLATTSARFPVDAEKLAVPGPGQYLSLVSGGGAAVSIGTAARDSTAVFGRVETGPEVGPGSYTMTSGRDGPMYSMGLPLLSTIQQSPDLGPGSYSPELASASPRAVIGTAPRGNAFEVPRLTVPGPGAYSVQDSVAQERPAAATFGSSPRMPPTVTSMVGPGTYEMAADDRVGGGVLGTAERFQTRPPEATPGPGEYDPNAKLVLATGPSALLGGAPHEHFVSKDALTTPGPGQYAPADEAKKHGVLFGTAQRTGDMWLGGDAPGPGAYDGDVRDHVPSVLFNSRRVEKLDPSNGPGQYDPVDPMHLQSRSVVIGTSARADLIPPNEIPGPGSYQPVDVGCESAPAAVVGLGQRFASPNVDTPGPGYYAPTAYLLQTGAAVFGTAERTERARHEIVPGPGAYNPLPLLTEPSITINAAPKVLGPAVTDAPGPGAYTPQLPQEHSYAVQFLGEKRLSGSGPEQTPGPGDYSPLAVGVTSGPSISFGNAPRLPPTTKLDAPGPGHYTIQEADHSPQVPMLTAPRPPLYIVTDAPGPGKYEGYDPAWTGHQSYTVPKAVPSQRPPDAPGPGEYSPGELQSNPQGVVFGTSAQREAFARASAAPGPGMYSPADVLPSAPAYSFGSAPKTADNRNDRLAPGPGAYDPALYAAETSPAYSFPTAGRVDVSPAEPTPGPAAYTLEERGASVAFTVPRALRFTREAVDTPGPTAYSPSVDAVLERAPGAVIGTAIAHESEPNDFLPGPGSYDVRSTILDGSPAFTFGRTGVRFAEVSTLSPGPVAYEPRNPNFDPRPAPAFPTAIRFPSTVDDGLGPGVYDIANTGDIGRGAGYSFGTSGRQPEPGALARMKLPGPGQYDTPAQPEGPFYSIRQRLPAADEKTAGEIPGPGAYDTAVPESVRTVTFGHAPHVDQDEVFRRRANAVPGPAAYSVPDTLDRRGHRIGTAVRMDAAEDAPSDYPGPGAYAVERVVNMFDGPQFSFPQDSRSRGGAATGGDPDMPGPGLYNAAAKDNVLPSSPGYSFPQAVREGTAGSGTAHYSLVGPGAYDLGRPPHQGPAFSFPQAATSGPGAAGAGSAGDGTGPGLYYRPMSWNRPGPTIQGKWHDDTKAAEGPGPGQYRMLDYDPYRSNAIAIDFSKGGERPCCAPVETVVSSEPGPGYYYRGGIIFGDGKGVPILNLPPHPYVEVTPGPGEYHKALPNQPFWDPLSH